MAEFDVNVFESDSDTEIIYYVKRIRKRKRSRRRVDYLEELAEREFVMRFRLSKQVVRALIELVKDQIASPTGTHRAIEPKIKVLLTANG